MGGLNVAITLSEESGQAERSVPMTAQESPFSIKNRFSNDLRGLTRHVLRSRGSMARGSMAGEPMAEESVEQVAAGLVSPSPAS